MYANSHRQKRMLARGSWRRRSHGAFNPLSNTTDPRWDWLRQRTWRCATCGQGHQGIIDLVASAPFYWQGSPHPLPNSAIIGSSHCLTEDCCIIDEQHYFVRCQLKQPLLGAGAGESFAFGVWSTLSEKNFGIYRDTFDDGHQGELGPWFGWFACRLRAYPETLSLKCRVHPQDAGLRPWIELEPTSEHPLARESREGIGYERLLEIYAAYGHCPVPDAH